MHLRKTARASLGVHTYISPAKQERKWRVDPLWHYKTRESRKFISAKDERKWQEDQFRHHKTKKLLWNRKPVSEEKIFGAVAEALRVDKTEYAIKAIEVMAGRARMGRRLISYMASLGDECTPMAMHYNDRSRMALRWSHDLPERKIVCDPLQISKHGKDFDIALIDGGVACFPEWKQAELLWQIRKTLKRGGRLAISDLSMMRENCNEANVILTLMHSLIGRDPNKDGICNVPTLNQWIDLIVNAGFARYKITMLAALTCRTNDWIGKASAMHSYSEAKEQELRSRLNEFIGRTAFMYPKFAHEFNVRMEDGGYAMDIPYVVIRAVRLV
jgi:hypothetical protein